MTIIFIVIALHNLVTSYTIYSIIFDEIVYINLDLVWCLTDTLVYVEFSTYRILHKLDLSHEITLCL